MSIFLKNIQEHEEVVSNLFSLERAVKDAALMATDTLQKGNKLLFCGNGGSAADSQHLAAELTGRFIKDRRPFAAMALSTDSSALTCIANDYSFDEVFARQVVGLGKRGDLLICISTSGCSINVIRAAEEAKKLGMQTVGLLGSGGGKLGEICTHSIVVPSAVTARVQECHILIGHSLCGLIEQNFGLG